MTDCEQTLGASPRLSVITAGGAALRRDLHRGTEPHVESGLPGRIRLYGYYRRHTAVGWPRTPQRYRFPHGRPEPGRSGSLGTVRIRASTRPVMTRRISAHRSAHPAVPSHRASRPAT